MTGAEISSRLSVSRQVVVQDIAILRAQGHPVISTPRGYMFSPPARPSPYRKVIACIHDREHVEDELLTMVEGGVEVVDVIVDHPVYGEITGNLFVRTPQDVKAFMARIEESGAKLLSSLTHGVHLHTISSDRLETLEKAIEALRRKGYLLEGGRQDVGPS